MTTRYQKSQIEDVARILHDAWGEAIDVGGMADRYMADTTVGNLAEDFADLFAVDNPQRCLSCTSTPDQESGYPCLHPAGHDWGGFNRAKFLSACGLESED